MSQAFSPEEYDRKIRRTLPYYEDFYRQVTELLEAIAPESEIGESLLLLRWRNFQVQNGISQEEADRHLARYGREYFPITVQKHLKLLKSCGFEAAELVWMSYMQAGFMAIKDEPEENQRI